MARSTSPRGSKGAPKRGIKRVLPMKMTIVSIVSVVIVEAGLIAALGTEQTNWKLVGPLLPALILLAAVLSYLFALTVSKPVEKIVNDVLTLAGGDYTRRSRIRSKDEIGILATAVNKLADSLEEAEKNKQVVSQLQDELSLAGEIQQLLLPRMIPKIPSLDLYPYYQAASSLGGDYYDFIPVSPEHLGIVIADVSGKGITGSMIMGIFRSILRRFAEGNTSARDVLIKTNELLSRDIKRGMFVTAYYMILHIPTKTITFSCAGHTPMVICRAMSGSLELVKPNGMALGFDTGVVFNRSIQEHKLRLMPGDRVVFFTDGITEAVNRQGEQYGEKNFFGFLKDYAHLSSKELLHELIEDLDYFKGKTEPNDDITVVTLKVKE